MDIRAFANEYRLRTRRDEDGGRIVPGKHGKIDPYDIATLAVMILGSTPRKWGFARRAGEAAGMTVLQDGDAEGTLLFDPSNAEQARTAIKIAAAKRKRIMSPAQREVLAKARKASPLMRRTASNV